MSTRNQRLCAWCGPLFALLFFVGFGAIARFLPPPSPSDSAAAVAAMYRHHADAIRLGMVISMFGLVFYVPWATALSVQLMRAEGRHTPLGLAQLALGAGLPVAFFPALYCFEDAAFRAGRPDVIIQTLNDMGWLPFTGIIYAIVVENLVIGFAVLTADRQRAVFPSWFGPFNFITAVLYIPACLDVFSTHGSLAWNGIWSLWLSLVAFFVWLVVTTVLELRAIGAQEAASEDLADADPSFAGRLEQLAAEVADLRQHLTDTGSVAD